MAPVIQADCIILWTVIECVNVPLPASLTLSFLLESLSPPGQELAGAEPEQRGGSFLHPGGRPGSGHAGGPGRVLL